MYKYTQYLYFSEPPVRQHLKNVYGTLMMTCASAVAGVYVDMYTWFTAGILSALVGAGLMLMLIATPDNGKNTNLRLGYLLGFGLTSGIYFRICILISGGSTKSTHG